MKSNKSNLQFLQIARNEWESPCFDAVPENKREEYRKRVKAVDMYIDGKSNALIEKVTKVQKSHIFRYVQYCLSENEFGKMAGYEALIPYIRKKEVTRQDDSCSSSGLFNLLLANYPELKEFIIGNFTGDKKYTLEKAMTFTSLHNKFLLKCRDLGIGVDDYPFNTQSQAKMSLRRYVCSITDKNPNLQESRLDSNAKQIQNSTGINNPYSKSAVIPYSTVQIDGHIIDLIYTTEVELDDGRIIRKECTRCWLIAVIDVATRCILGYSLSQEANYNQYDILKAIQNSIIPHERYNYTIPGLKSPESGGFPDVAYNELKYALFDTIMLDNAKSHLAFNVINKICNELKCTLDFGSVSTPETRGIIERFFETIETRGFHRIVSTTGSNTKDVKRNNPEKAAVKYEITFDEICEIVESLIEQYNNTQHSALFKRTPIEEMGEKLSLGMKPYICSNNEIETVNDFLLISNEVTVRGNKKEGRRPYIHFLGAKYRNDVLASDYSLLNKRITITYNPDDISSVKAFLPNGKCIGELKAVGEFGRIAHSVKSRREILKYARENEKNNNIFATPVTDYENHLKEKAKNSRSARTKAEILRREMGKADPSKQEVVLAEIIDFNQKVNNSKCSITAEDIMTLPSEEVWAKIERGV